MTPLYDTLRDVLAGKATELFADYGVTCTPLDTDPPSSSLLCGILGFTGDQLCGSVVIAATVDAISRTNPIGDGPTRGWVAELTNQLVGRFKNQLFRGGIEVAMSVPVVLTATQLTPLPQAQAAPIKMQVAEGSVTIWLEIEATPGLMLSEPGADSEIAAEGESMMF